MDALREKATARMARVRARGFGSGVFTHLGSIGHRVGSVGNWFDF